MTHSIMCQVVFEKYLQCPVYAVRSAKVRDTGTLLPGFREDRLTFDIDEKEFGMYYVYYKK